LVGALAVGLVGKGKDLIAYLKQNLPTRRIQITVGLLSVITVVLCSFVAATVARSNYVSIPLTPYMGKLALTDPLQNNSLGYRWTPSPLDSAGCTFTQAGYKVIAKQLHSYQSCFAEQTNFSAFAYQADMVFLQGSGGGIIFRDGNTAYNATIDITGQFILFTFNPLDQQQDTLVQGFPTGYIGYNKRITLTLVVKSETIEVYLGTLCVTCNQQTIVRRTPSYGPIGVFALIENGQPETQTEVLFENVQVWNL